MCCHFSLSGQYFIFSLLLTFDEHVKCNDSDQEMTKLMSKPCYDTNGGDKTDDVLWCNGQSDCCHSWNLTSYLSNQDKILMKLNMVFIGFHQHPENSNNSWAMATETCDLEIITYFVSKTKSARYLNVSSQRLIGGYVSLRENKTTTKLLVLRFGVRV